MWKERRKESWSWNEEVKEAIGQKKVPYKKMCINRFEENTTRYQNRKNQTKKAIADSRKKELTELNEKSKSIF